MAEARRLLDRTQRVANAKSVAPVIHAKIAACRVALALAQNDLSAARHWAERVAQNTATSLDHPRIGLAEVYLLLAENRHTVARQILERRLEAANTAGLWYVVIEIRVLLALAAPSLSEALSYLEEALKLAEPEGYIRTFVDKGDPMAALLLAVRLQRVAPRYLAELLAAFGAERRGVASQARPLPSPTERGLASSGTAGPVEPLSERELEVLQLVTEGLTNQEIAERLVITVGTVKTHVHHIYGKLNVRSRAEAAARARAVNL
jgi:LuxR family maltose regulon positive regulatory protein